MDSRFCILAGMRTCSCIRSESVAQRGPPTFLVFDSPLFTYTRHLHHTRSRHFFHILSPPDTAAPSSSTPFLPLLLPFPSLPFSSLLFTAMPLPSPPLPPSSLPDQTPFPLSLSLSSSALSVLFSFPLAVCYPRRNSVAAVNVTPVRFSLPFSTRAFSPSDPTPLLSFGVVRFAGHR